MYFIQKSKQHSLPKPQISLSMNTEIYLVMFIPMSHSAKELIGDDCPLMQIKSLIIAGFQSGRV